MRVRKPGRYLAPLALVAVVVATLLVVQAGLGTKHHATASTQAAHTSSKLLVSRRKVFYRIRPGDSLSTISVKTGVSVSQLEALNPSVDPNALQAGQRLRLRRKGAR